MNLTASKTDRSIIRVRPALASTFVPSRNHRFHLLDALRGIAAVLVVLWHFPPYLRSWSSYPNGYLAVDFFFCLSGFVIAFSYEARLQAGMRIRDFTVARVIRLYPLYLLGTILGLTATILVAHALSDPAVTHFALGLVFGLSLFLLPNLFVHGPLPYSFPLNAPAWSLFYEMLANVIYALLVRFRLAGNWLVAIIATCSFAILLHHVLPISGKVDVGPSPSTFYLGIARVGFSFFVGVLVYRLYVRMGHPRFSGHLRLFMPLLVAASLVAALLFSLPIAKNKGFQLAIIAVLFPAVVYAGACCKLSPGWGRLAAFLGDFSYPLYILHVPFLLPVSGRKMRSFALQHGTLATFFTFVSILVLVALSWWTAEAVDSPVRVRLAAKYKSRIAGKESESLKVGEKESVAV